MRGPGKLDDDAIGDRLAAWLRHEQTQTLELRSMHGGAQQ
jgi:hypothetical protein